MSKTRSKVYNAEDIDGSRRAGIGREVYPNLVTDEEWKAQGARVRDEPFDAIAVGFLSDADGNHREHWGVLLSPDDTRIELAFAAPNSYSNQQPLYEGLARDLKRYLGRSGLTILVGY